MPGRAEPPRNLGAMRDVQSQRNTPRRSSEFLKNIDAVLSEVDDSDAAREIKKAKNTAAIEKTFPGVEEDEKTLSGMYEPALHNFPLGEQVQRFRRPDVGDIHVDEFGEERSRSRLTSPMSEQLSMFPKSKYHVEEGTGPANVGPSERRFYDFQESDLDPDTTDYFGTDRIERDYVGFQQEGPSEFQIDSPEYWAAMDTRSHNPQVRHAANMLFRNHDDLRPDTRAASSIFGTSRRRRNPTNRRSRNPEAGPVTNVRNAAQFMATGDPARAGSTRYSGGRHSFRGRAEPPYEIGMLPEELTPGRRNIETDYTVYSYNTPIAWRATTGHWEVPNISYSNTTSRHQSAIRSALGNTHHSPIDEARQRVYNLRQQHREQGFNLPSTKYELNVGFETFHPEPPSEETINAIVEDHVQQVINPAIERRRNSRSFQRQQRLRNQHGLF